MIIQYNDKGSILNGRSSRRTGLSSYFGLPDKMLISKNDRHQKQEGFKGQIKHVIPRPLLRSLLGNPLFSDLYPTDVGYYPVAGNHFRSRPEGAEETILIYCVKGKGSYQIQNARGTVLPQQGLLIPPHTPHEYSSNPSDPWSIYFIHFSGLNSDFYQSLLSENRTPFSVSPKMNDPLEKLFHETFNTLNRGFSPCDIIHSAQLIRLILSTLLYRNPEFSAHSFPSDKRDFSAIIDFMKQHSTRNLTLGEISSKAGLSPARFTALFTRQIGAPPVTFHIRLRIQYACLLLDTTPLSIKEVAVKMGYPDPYYFTRIFHKFMGLSPKAYRKSRAG